MISQPPVWFANAITKGVGRLRGLGAPYSPSDEIKFTARVWYEALWEAGPRWHEGMMPRIEAAFTELVNGFRLVPDPEARRGWPQPVDFLAALDHIAAKPGKPVDGQLLIGGGDLSKGEIARRKEFGRRYAKDFWNKVRAKLIERDAKVLGDGLRSAFAIPSSSAEAKAVREPGEES